MEEFYKTEREGEEEKDEVEELIDFEFEEERKMELLDLYVPVY